MKERNPASCVEQLEARRLLAAGDLVTSFADDGILEVVVEDPYPSRDILRTLVETADAKLLTHVMAYDRSFDDRRDYLVQYNADGSPDTGFSGDGVLQLPETSLGAPVTGAGLLILPDGDVLLVRSRTAEVFQIERMNPDGTFDTDYGQNGVLVLQAVDPRFALMPSGELVLADYETLHVNLWIYNLDGTLKDSHMQITASAGLRTDEFYGIDGLATDAQSNIYFAGPVQTERILLGQRDVRRSVFKVTPDLEVDDSYGTFTGEAIGEARYNGPGLIQGIDVDDHGRVSMLISAGPNGSFKMNVVRFDEDGILEMDAGQPLTAFSLTPLLQPNGRIVMWGDFEGSDGKRTAGAARLLKDGTPDAGFGGNLGAGVQEYLTSEVQDEFHRWGLITSTGDLVVVGEVIGAEEVSYIIARIDLGDINEEDNGSGGAIFDRNITSQLVIRSDGRRVLEIVGNGGRNRIVLQSDTNGQVRLLNGGAGSQTISGVYALADLDHVEVIGGGGDDELVNELGGAFIGFVTLLGGAGNDHLNGNGRYDRLFGEDGDDSLVGGDGDQLLLGGAGSDTLAGSGGRDALFGGEGSDVLNGSIGDDFLDGGEADDTLLGEAGNDTLVGGAGSDSLSGGADRDILSFFARQSGVMVDLTALTATADGETDALADDLEDLLGGAGGDMLVGNAGRNRLFGAAGNDTLRGMDGKDQLFGGQGLDLLEGGDDFDWLLDLDNAADRLIGGGGFDVALSDAEDDEEQAERVTHSAEEFLASL